MFGRTLQKWGSFSGLVARVNCARAARGGCGGARPSRLSVLKSSSNGSSSRSRCLMVSERHGRSRDCGLRTPYLLLSAAVFSIFSKPGEGEDGDDDDEGLSESEQKVVYLLKKAKLSIMKEEVDEAEDILHEALYLAQECKSKRAIIYTYDLMANLEFLRGHYDNAEKLFKITMVYMLDSGVRQDENSFLEISLKLASIYASLNQKDLAVAGFQFCIISLDEKAAKERDLPPEVLTAEEKTNTRLLLGLCLDSYARYLASQSQLLHAQTMYEKALQICTEEQGDCHPQTITLLNDLGTVLEAQGRYDEAYTYVSRALQLAEKSEHPDHHIMLCNMATILMHQAGRDHLADAEQIFKKALAKAREKNDPESVQNIRKGLSELLRRKEEKGQSI